MTFALPAAVEEAKQAALEVLLYNARDGRNGLPRTAAWGYHEPYTRDLLIGALGTLVSDQPELVASLGRVLLALADNQSPHGHIPSLVDVPVDRGASDTTPLFLIALALYQKATGDAAFLADPGHKATFGCVTKAQKTTSSSRKNRRVIGVTNIEAQLRESRSVS